MRIYYKLVGITRDNRGKIKGYILKSLSSGKLIEKTSNEIKSAIRNDGVQIEGLRIINGRLYIRGMNEVSSRKQVNKSMRKRDLKPKINLYTGNALFSTLKLIEGYKPRWYVNTIVDRLVNPKDLSLTAIYGIRRTGKTVSMWHTIEKLLHLGITSSDILYIELQRECSISELEIILKRAKQTYIFIDEVTMVRDFIEMSKVISDSYIHKRIVMCGTDSLAINIAQSDSLFGRVYNVRSNLISFNEYRDLFNIENRNEAVRKFLANGGTTYEIQYSNERAAYDTINTSIVGNILNTLNRNKTNQLESVKGLSSIQIAYIVYCIIMDMMCTKGDKIEYKNISENVMELLLKLNGEKHISLSDKSYITSGLKKEHWKDIKLALMKLDVTDSISNLAKKSSGVEIESHNELVCYISGMYYSVVKAVNKGLQDINLGAMVENLVIQQCLIWCKSNKVSYDKVDEYETAGYCRYKDLSDNKVKEIDVVIPHTYGELWETKTTYNLIEVKCAGAVKPNQVKNFKAESLYDMYGENTNNIVVYMGETQKLGERVQIEVRGKTKYIQYVNLYDFLSDIGKWLI